MSPNLDRLAIVLGLALALAGCRGWEEQAGAEGERSRPMPVPLRALRAGVETQMTALLRDIADAQERAHIDQGRYLRWDELRQSYYPDPIPENLEVRMTLLGEHGYEAEVVHGPSGVRCGLGVGTGAGPGAPRCR